MFVEDAGERVTRRSRRVRSSIRLRLVQMEAVYIPEEDRCTDMLSLVEDPDNLK